MHIRLTGELLIGSHAFTGTEGFVCALDPATNQTMGPTFGLASRADVARACELAWQAFRGFRESELEQRAAFLERIGDNLLALGDALVERAAAESGLPRWRIEGERARTMNQLRLFAAVVREGSWMELRIDPALPHRSPAPRPGLRQRHVGVGPVAVFGASNFPLAFSVAGGDTASALAAGCPVVAKAHPAHPGTSELVGRAIQSAVAQSDLHEGVFSLLHAGTQAGQDLVAHPRIKAVGFTGSRAGGMALMAVAAAREEPIPVYAEMSSLNPVVLLPAALTGRAGDIARAFVASLTLGSGQFCTNPGLLLAQEGPGLKAFLAAAGAAVESTPAATMLTPGIFEAYGQGVDRLSAHAGVQAVAQGLPGKGPHACRAALFATPAAQFIADRALHREVFGAASLLVRCRNEAELVAVLECLEGQLTATLHMDKADEPQARRLLPLLEEKAGRLVVNGFPTGVEVGHATVHGGPYPATSDPRSTSVGSLAIRRFLRPVCYQDMPQALLPPALRDGSLVRGWRRLDGEWVAPGGPEAVDGLEAV